MVRAFPPPELPAAAKDHNEEAHILEKEYARTFRLVSVAFVGFWLLWLIFVGTFASALFIGIWRYIALPAHSEPVNVIPAGICSSGRGSIFSAPRHQWRT